MIPMLHAGFLLFLVVVFPLWDRRETARLKAHPSAAIRIRSYQRTIAWLWLATGFLLATTPWATLVTPPDLPGLADISGSSLGIAMAIALTVGIIGPVVVALRSPAALSAQLRQVIPLAFFLPQSAPERRWFAGVSVTAGICEELIFRGFLIGYLSLAPWHLPPLLAVLLAAAIFGLDHGYQGWSGVLLTGLLALVFTALYFLTEQLWVAMAFHALFDLRVLVLLWLGRDEWPAAIPGRFVTDSATLSNPP